MTVESLVSGHKINRIRERLADKLEFMFFDPYGNFYLLIKIYFCNNLCEKLIFILILVQQEVMYREKKKLCNIYRLKDKSKPYPVRKKHYWES